MSAGTLRGESRDLVFRSFEEANYYYRDRFLSSWKKQLGDAAQRGDEKAEVDLYKRLYDALSAELTEDRQKELFSECLKPLTGILSTVEGRGYAARMLGDHCLEKGWPEAEEFYREAIDWGMDGFLDNPKVLKRCPNLMYHWIDKRIDGAQPDDRATKFVFDHAKDLMDYEFSRSKQPSEEVPPESASIKDAIDEWRGSVAKTMPSRLFARSRMLSLCQWIASHRDGSLEMHRQLVRGLTPSECVIPYLLYANRIYGDDGCETALKWLRVLVGSPPDWEVWISTSDSTDLLKLVFDACGQ